MECYTDTNNHLFRDYFVGKCMIRMGKNYKIQYIQIFENKFCKETNMYIPKKLLEGAVSKY